MAEALTTWIHFAIRKKVRALHLDFIGCGVGDASACYRLPSVVFSEGECLRELKLVACDIKRIAQVQLRSLKKSLLSQAVLDDNTMDQILSGCYVLEELHVLDCYGLSRLGFRSPSIKSLEVTIWHEIGRLEIWCPNIVSLDLCGQIEHVNLVDVSSVACASLTCHNLSQSELSAYLKVFNKLDLTDLSFQWKYLELKLAKIKWHHPGIIYLLSMMKYICYKHKIFDSGELWSSQAGICRCLGYHPKTARIYGDVTEPNVIEFIEFLLKNAMFLEKLVISTKRIFQPTRKQHSHAHKKVALSKEKMLKACQKLCISPRASRCARIIFS
ncbi:hypothetical protein DITRI_Ditri16bG0097400 [Diplodiscus trichospermus]